jgi:hypothetical protein
MSDFWGHGVATCEVQLVGHRNTMTVFANLLDLVIFASAAVPAAASDTACSAACDVGRFFCIAIHLAGGATPRMC